MPRHPHEPVTPTLPFPPVPPAPPCGCVPPRMRPEPFSPGGLPAPHGFDFGGWAREKINWLLSLVPSAASPDNLLADREWVAGQAIGGKADKVAGATDGNLAGLDSEGNLTDSGKKAGDFATAAQGTKADAAIQGVKVNGTALTPDANKAVNVQVPSAGSALPLIAGVSDAGSSANFSREDHVHPAETAVLPTGYVLPASAFPVSYYGQSTSDPADIELFEATADSGDVPYLPPSYGEVIAMRLSWRDPTEYAAAAFNKSSGAFIRGDGALTFNGNSGVEGVSPVLTARDSTVIVRGVEVASRVANATAGNLAALDASGNPMDSGKKAGDFQSALSDVQLANIAAVSDALAFDATHSYAAGDPVVYIGTLYTFTAAHTGAWTGSDVSAVDIISRLAGKLGNTGNQTLNGTLEIMGGGTYVPTRIEAGRIVLDNDSVGRATIDIPFRINTTCTLALLQNLAPDFSTSATYAVGQLCVYANKLYRCTTAITTAEAWTAAHWTQATVEDVLAALRTTIAGKADVSAIPYALVTQPIVGNGVILEDRASNSVTISATLSPNTLRIHFLPALIGKARDFAMRLNIAAGVTAPEIAWPQGVTLENNGGEVPEIADGGTGGSSTILYFSETENDGTTAKFLVKGETLTAIAQA